MGKHFSNPTIHTGISQTATNRAAVIDESCNSPATTTHASNSNQRQHKSVPEAADVPTAKPRGQPINAGPRKHHPFTSAVQSNVDDA